jgi:hypothetical protein
MTESIPTMWTGNRDAAFFGIIEALAADGFAADTAQLTTAVSSGADWTARIEKVLEDLVVAESWELMAKRSASRSDWTRPELVPVAATVHLRKAA